MPIQQHSKVTGLSGNEIYCLKKLNYLPGQLCIGNNVVSLGVGGGIKSGLSTLAGGLVEFMVIGTAVKKMEGNTG
jgi:hypothetical protein